MTCHAGVVCSSMSHASLGSHRIKYLCHMTVLFNAAFVTVFVMLHFGGLGFLLFWCVALNCFLNALTQRADLGECFGTDQCILGMICSLY